MNSVPATQTSLNTCDKEVQDYIESPCLPEDANPLEYWLDNQSKYPTLALLAKRYLSVPASSAPVERLFSIGGKILRNERCSMSDRTFERLMFVKNNRHFSM